MRRGLTAAFTTWLALIALQTFASSSSTPKRVRELFQDIDSILERALDPTVPAIPDRSRGPEDDAGTTSTGTRAVGTVLPKAASAAGTSTTRPATSVGLNQWRPV